MACQAIERFSERSGRAPGLLIASNAWKNPPGCRALALQGIRLTQGIDAGRRDFVKLAGLAGCGLIAAPWAAACRDVADAMGPSRESLDATPGRASVEAYTDATSYRPGDTVRFHLSDNW